MKQPFDIAQPGFEPKCYSSVANRANRKAMGARVNYRWKYHDLAVIARGN